MNQEIQNESRWCESPWIKCEWYELCSLLRSLPTAHSSSKKAESRGVPGRGAEGQSQWRGGCRSQSTHPGGSCTGISRDDGQKRNLLILTEGFIHPGMCWKGTQHGAGNPGASYTGLVIISYRESRRGEPGVMCWWLAGGKCGHCVRISPRRPELNPECRKRLGNKQQSCRLWTSGEQIAVFSGTR